MDQHGILNWVRTGVWSGVLAGAMLASVNAEEVLVSWEAKPYGMLSPSWSASISDRWVGNTYLASVRDLDIEVLSEASEMATLFGGIPILRVGGGTPESGSFALRSRAFVPPSMKGALEFQVALDAGRIFLTFGQNPTDFLEGNDQTVILKSADSMLTMIIEPNGPIRCNKKVYYPQSMSGMEPGKPFKLTVAWDFESATPHFSATVNGEPLIEEATGQPFEIPVTPIEAERGVDSFVLSGDKDGNSRYHIGNITSVAP